MTFDNIKEKAERYESIIADGERVFENTTITEKDLDDFIKRVMEESNWDEFINDLCVTPRDADWYDNVPSFSYDYDEFLDASTIYLRTSDGDFREEAIIEDENNPEDLYEAILSLISQFVDYFQYADRKRKEKVKRELTEDIERVVQTQFECQDELQYYEDIRSAIIEGKTPRFNAYSTRVWFKEWLSMYGYEEWKEEYGLDREEISSIFGGEEKLADIAVSIEDDLWSRTRNNVAKELEDEENNE